MWRPQGWNSWGVCTFYINLFCQQSKTDSDHQNAENKISFTCIFNFLYYLYFDLIFNILFNIRYFKTSSPEVDFLIFTFTHDWRPKYPQTFLLSWLKLSYSRYLPKQEMSQDEIRSIPGFFSPFFFLLVVFCLRSCSVSVTSSEETLNNGSLSSRRFFSLSVCLKVSSCLVWDLWIFLSFSLSLARLLKQSHKIGRKCLFDANPNKSAAVRGHSLRCLRVLTQTCLMSWSADIYSAAASCIYIKREKEGQHTADCSWNTLWTGGERHDMYRSGWESDQVDGRDHRQSYPTFYASDTFFFFYILTDSFERWNISPVRKSKYQKYSC